MHEKERGQRVLAAAVRAERFLRRRKPLGIALLDVASREEPDVLLTDIRLKGETNGIELARRFHIDYPTVKIIVLTNYSNEPYIKAMMEIGVKGYILKDTPAHDVIESVRMVMNGRTVYSEQISNKIVKGYLGEAFNHHSDGADRVTERESEVLSLLASGASNPEIAEYLHVSVGTIQFHLTSLYGKLGVRNRAEAVIQAAKEGLVVIDE